MASASILVMATVSLSSNWFLMSPGGDKLTPSAVGHPGDVYGFTVQNIDGQDVSLSKYKGDVLMIVNVASQCGYTDKTYSGLETVFQKYKEKGFKVLAFPANNFGGQEPGSNSEIKSFCASKMKATFDLFAKVSVAGDDQAPLFRFLTGHPDEKIAGPLKWNFEKYLVGRDGTVLARFGTRTLPTDPQVTEAIENALAKPK